MKIRTDFVTNSSSSSFTLMIDISLTDGYVIKFDGHGGTGETGRIDYFDNAAVVSVSPKQLGNARDVEELIKLLEEGVRDGLGGKKIFDESRPRKSDCCYEELVYFLELDEDEEDEDQEFIFDAYEFIEEIRDNVSSMDEIEEINIYTEEVNDDKPYVRRYSYNLQTKKYTGMEDGKPIIADNSGYVELDDIDTCEIRSFIDWLLHN